MFRFYRFFIFLLLFYCCNLPASESKVLNIDPDPCMIFNDGIDQLIVKVTLNNSSYDNIKTKFSLRGLRLQENYMQLYLDGIAISVNGITSYLYNDGTHGDEIAGDNIWTRNGFTSSSKEFLTDPLFPELPNIGYGLLGCEIYFPDGLIERKYCEYMILDQVLQSYSNITYSNEHIGISSYFVNYAHPNAVIKTDDYMEYTRGDSIFYQLFKDQYDIFNSTPSYAWFTSPFNASYGSYQTNVSRGLGNTNDPIRTDEGPYLLGFADYSFHMLSVFNHEVMHAWTPACFNVGGINISCAHWYNCNIEGVHSYGYKIIENLDGSITAIDNAGNNSYPGEWELYCSGHFPYTDLFAYIWAWPSISAPDPFKAFTIPKAFKVTKEEIINTLGGERVPSFNDSQKHYNFAWLVSSRRKLHQAETAYFNYNFSFIESNEEVPGPQNADFVPFKQATRNMGTASCKLKDRLGNVVVDIARKWDYNSPAYSIFINIADPLNFIKSYILNIRIDFFNTSNSPFYGRYEVYPSNFDPLANPPLNITPLKQGIIALEPYETKTLETEIQIGDNFETYSFTDQAGVEVSYLNIFLYDMKNHTNVPGYYAFTLDAYYPSSKTQSTKYLHNILNNRKIVIGNNILKYNKIYIEPKIFSKEE